MLPLQSVSLILCLVSISGDGPAKKTRNESVVTIFCYLVKTYIFVVRIKIFDQMLPCYVELTDEGLGIYFLFAHPGWVGLNTLTKKSMSFLHSVLFTVKMGS